MSLSRRHAPLSLVSDVSVSNGSFDELARFVRAPAARLATRIVELPHRLGPYDLLQRAGSGGIGAVFRARDRRIERDVAVKLLLPTTTGASDALLAEARAAGSIRHANVVQVLACEEIEGELVLVSEWVNGVDLRRALLERAPTLEQRMRWCREIASGVAAAHARGIVHLDLKPENVLLDDDDTCRVADFGLAQRMRDDGGTSTARGGTPRYASPEQRRGDPVDARADVYSIGVLFAELLGQHTKDPTQTGRFSILSRRVASSDLWTWNRIIARCTTDDPAGRFGNARELLRALDSQRRIARWVTACAACALLVASVASVADALRTPSPRLLDSEPLVDTMLPRYLSPTVISEDGRVEYLARGALCGVHDQGDRSRCRPLRRDSALEGALRIERLGRSAVIVESRPGLTLFDGTRRVVIAPHSTESVAGSPDGRHVAYLHEGRLVLWSEQSGARTLTIAPRVRGVHRDLAFSPDGRYVATSVHGEGPAQIVAYPVEGDGEPRVLLSDPRIVLPAPCTVFTWTEQGLYVGAMEHPTAPYGLYWLPLSAGLTPGRLQLITSWTIQKPTRVSSSTDGTRVLVELADYGEMTYTATWSTESRRLERIASISGRSGLRPAGWTPDAEALLLNIDSGAEPGAGLWGADLGLRRLSQPVASRIYDPNVGDDGARYWLTRAAGRSSLAWHTADGATPSIDLGIDFIEGDDDRSRFNLRCGGDRCVLARVDGGGLRFQRFADGRLHDWVGFESWSRGVYNWAIDADAEHLAVMGLEGVTVQDSAGQLVHYPVPEGCQPPHTGAYVSGRELVVIAYCLDLDRSSTVVFVADEGTRTFVRQQELEGLWANHLRVAADGRSAAFQGGHSRTGAYLLQIAWE